MPEDQEKISLPPSSGQSGDLEKTMFQIVVSVGDFLYRPFPEGFDEEQTAVAAAEFLLSDENKNKADFMLDNDGACVFICRVISCYGKKITIAKLF